VRKILLLVLFVFLFSLVCQSLTAGYYIASSGFKVFSTIFLNSYLISVIWSLFLFICLGLYWNIKKSFRIAFLGIWFCFFMTNMAIWSINIGVLKFAGVEISPSMIGTAQEAGEVFSAWFKDFSNFTPLVLFAISLVILGYFFFNLKHSRLSYLHKGRYWAGLIALIISLIPLKSSWQTLPEYFVLRNFTELARAESGNEELSEDILQKLQRFGIDYQIDKFQVNHQDHIFDESQKLPSLKVKNPNIVVFFLESFSADLTSVYNSKTFPQITPNLEKIAQNSETTTFYNFYNAATPTINGLISNLCSFLAPTGNDEMSQTNEFEKYNLKCLPHYLKENKYQDISYFSGASKTYAHKNELLQKLGIPQILGESELKSSIKAKPLSWGFSDQQLFPQIWQKMQSNPQQFAYFISSIDSHQPYNLSQDMINYQEGKYPILNAIHTTDFALGKFWDQFINSELAKNTIVIITADHTSFPSAYDNIQKFFPKNINRSFYGEIPLLMYIPQNPLPAKIDTYSSSIDLSPTLLQLLNINGENAFEGKSILDNRPDFPNLLGFNEFNLYVNQVNEEGQREIWNKAPAHIVCKNPESTHQKNNQLNACDYLQFYKWKRQALAEGRFNLN